MKINQTKLLDELIIMTQNQVNRVEKLLTINQNLLNFKKDENSWSILECIEHLNRYGEFYIPEITKQIKGSNSKNQTFFKSGLLGNYFAKSMLPKEKLNKMKTFKSMNPDNSLLDNTVLKRFKSQLVQILDLLETCKSVDIQKVKTSISISKFIKLRLGDTLRVVIYHNERHIQQAENLV